MTTRALTLQTSRAGGGTDFLADAREGPERRDRSTSPNKMKALTKVAQKALRDGPAFAARSQLGPVGLELRCNLYSLYGFWRDNWFPDYAREGSGQADGTVTAAMGMNGREAAAYYCRQSAQIALLDCPSYVLCRDWTLGMVAQLATAHGLVGLQAASLTLDGSGVVVCSEDAQLLAAFALSCAMDCQAQIQNLTWTLLDPGADGEPVRAVRTENAFWVPTACARYDQRLRRILRAAPWQGVVTRKDACTNMSCLSEAARGARCCVFDQGQDRCYWSNPEGGALLHEGMLPEGARAGGEPMPVSLVVLLAANPENDSLHGERLEPRLAFKTLSRGLQAGTTPWCTPQLIEPVGEVFRALVERCMEKTDCLALKAGGSLAEAASGLAQLCKAQRDRKD